MPRVASAAGSATAQYTSRREAARGGDRDLGDDGGARAYATPRRGSTPTAAASRVFTAENPGVFTKMAMRAAHVAPCARAAPRARPEPPSSQTWRAVVASQPPSAYLRALV